MVEDQLGNKETQTPGMGFDGGPQKVFAVNFLCTMLL